MTNLLHLEGSSGISGDMTVAALLDLGGDRDRLQRVLNSLPLDGYRIEISRKKPDGIVGCDFNVLLDDHAHEHVHEHAHDHARRRKRRRMAAPLKKSIFTKSARSIPLWTLSLRRFCWMI